MRMIESINQLNRTIGVETRTPLVDAQALFESVSAEEHAELLRLADAAEALTVERLKAVVELAKYRNLPLDEMMRQLGMTPGKHAR